MSTKIQINSLEALERLIGNDTELEIELRSSVVENFARRHLKTLVATELMGSISKAIQNEIKAEYFDEIKTGQWSATKTVFKQDVVDNLKKDLKWAAQSELSEIVSEVIGEYKIHQTIKEQLDKTVEWITEQLAPQHLEKRIEKLVDARLKEKLGLK